MENNMLSIISAYKQKQDCIIIALTGRTGSGCTTVARILNRQRFSDLDLHSPEAVTFKTTDDRKYAIVHKYMNEGNNWSPFIIIEGSSILFSFVLQEGFDKFINYIKHFGEINDKNKIRIGGFSELITRLDSIKEHFSGCTYNLADLDLATSPSSVIENYYTYYIQQLPLLKHDFEQILNDYTCYGDLEEDTALKFKKANLYSFFMQSIGNNIRSSGDPFIDTYDGKNYYSVAERIEKVILLIQKIKGTNTRICIDAIRNPYEAFYFRDKYSSFYLVSVNTDDKTRKERLSYLDSEEIESLDNKEYLGGHQNSHDIFYHQDISGCLEIADIHLYNPQETSGKLFFLSRQIVKYVSLMIHPGLITPSNIERCMQLAYTVKLNSGCLSRQVGAVITGCDFSVKAVGWNDVPSGQVSCNLRDVCNYCINKDPQSYSTFEIEDSVFSEALHAMKKKTDSSALHGRTLPFCFKDVYNSIKKDRNQVYTRSLHAEENAFLQLAKHGGTSIQGGFLFTTASPCELCSKKAYQLGIRDIYYIDPYPGISFSHILSFGNKQNPSLHPFFGAIGSAYVSLYTQRISVKDELKLMTGISGRKALTYIKDEDIQSTLCVQDAKYIERKLTFSFINRENMNTTDECVLQSKKDNLDRIPILYYWSGDYYGEIEAVIISDSKSQKVSLSDERKTPQSYRGYILLDKPLKKGECIRYATTVNLRDSLHVMSPYYSQYISIQTDSLSIELKAPANMLSNVRGVLYADKNLSPSQKVEEEEIIVQQQDNACSYNYAIGKPNLNCSYCVEWNYSK